MSYNERVRRLIMQRRLEKYRAYGYDLSLVKKEES